MQVLVHNASGTSGMPQKGAFLGKGAEGSVYKNLDQPGTVVKEFDPARTSPLQARNEFENLERARGIHPDNAAKPQAPANPRQGWLVKEEVIPDVPSPANQAALGPIAQDFINGGVHDVGPNNFMFGHTADNPIPRWILIE